MKKTKYIYKHYIYGGGPNGYCDGAVSYTHLTLPTKQAV